MHTCVAFSCGLTQRTSSVDFVRDKIQELRNMQEELQDRIDQATREGDIISDDVRNWISEAARVSQEAESFLDNDCQRAHIKCFGGSLPNLLSRRGLSTRAVEKADELARVIQAAAGDRFRTISSCPAMQSCIADRGSYEDFETRNKVLEAIMDALSCDEVRRVGVYGMGGMGKTMLAKEAARLAVARKLFSEVVFTTVSQNKDPKAIQQDVAEKIHLNLDGIKSASERADRLKRRLKEEKKVLLILDDIWDRLELADVGLHFDDDQKGCKILMTSRSLDVIQNYMGAERNFLVDDLSSSEAENMFTKIVGTTVVEQPDFKGLANDVVRECGGLPLAISTVACALKDKNLAVWKDALLQLKNSAPTNIDGMLTHVYPSIRLSFDYLESEEAKKLLLLCSLYGKDVAIAMEELVKLSLGWGFFPDVHTVAAVRGRVDTLVIKLKARCLLLDGYHCDMVKMHDVVRDVAQLIASGHGWCMHRFMINDRLEDCLSKKNLKDSKAISLLLDTEYNILPERSLQCPQLELFFVSPTNSSAFFHARIPIKDFLKESKELKALSLNRADLVPLPSPFQSLQNLQTLRLYDCKLDEIGDIGDLKNLRVLDLRRSTLKYLPSKIGQLNRLQVLNLEGCQGLKVIKENVISRLTELEELYIAKTFDWEVGEVGTDRRSNANLAELMNLQKLATLSLAIPDAEKMFPKHFVFSQGLERYNISIGLRQCRLISWFRDGMSRSLALRGSERSQLNALGLEALMRRLEQLSLDGILGVKNNVVYELDKEGFRQLKMLEVLNCGVEYIVNVVDQKSSVHPCTPVFRSLETLHLKSLANLKKICHHVNLTADSFNQLREVSVENCGRLKNLFPLSIARRLHRIEVTKCEMMEELVALDQREDKVAFDELRYLHLQSLPKFVRLIHSPQVDVITGPSSVESLNYPLFDEKDELSRLQDLSLSQLNVESLWPDINHKLLTTSYMENLTCFHACACNKLKYLFTLSVAERLVKLEALKVQNCSAMEDIIVTNKKLGGKDQRSSERILFPKLESLELSKLPALKKFYVRDDYSIQLSSLSSLKIEYCPELKILVTKPLFNDKDKFSRLKDLSLSQLNVESLWPDIDHKLLATSYMENLTCFHACACTKLKYLFTLAIAERLVKLKALKVQNCSAMEDIIVTNKKLGREVKRNSEKILFPKLESLELSKLPALKRFCVGDDYCIQLSSLSSLKIEYCPELKIFVDNQEENQLTTKPLFNDKVVLSMLRTWQVKRCNNLKYLSSFVVAKSLIKLQELKMDECSSLEEVFIVTEKQGSDNQDGRSLLEKLSFPQLHYLRLANLPNLKTFCATLIDEEKSLFNDMVEFSRLQHLKLSKLNVGSLWPDIDHKLLATSYMENLITLHVSACDKLKYLFTLTIVERLVKLEALRVQNSSAMKDIIVINKKLGSKNSEKILFPKLNSVMLYNLPVFRKLYAGDDCRIQLLSLLRIRIGNCPELKTFVDNQEDNQLATKPLFNDKMIITSANMMPLVLGDISIAKLWEDKLSLPICTWNLEVLSVSGFKNLKHLLSSAMCVSLVQLKRLTIKSCEEMQEVVAIREEPGSTAISTNVSLLFPNLESLYLRDLPKLKGFCEGDCVAFPLLSRLKVLKCNELTYLLASSTARSLVNIRSMMITSCKQMTEIIKDFKEGKTTEEGTEDDHFDFKRLEILVLHDLPTLKSFYPGNNAMRFPRLRKLFLNKCPLMKSFSPRLISTSMLMAIIIEIKGEVMWQRPSELEEYAEPMQERWDGDVNTTIRKLWEENSNSLLPQQSCPGMDAKDSAKEGTSSLGAKM